MHAISRTAILALAVGTALAGLQEAGDGISADEIRAHIYFLSRDELQGRAPGTPGADVAAEYIKTQFMRMGLEPVDGSYFQEVPLTGVTTDPTTLSLAFEVEDGRVPGPYPSEAVIWPAAPGRPAIQLSGELVFVGYGINAPEWGWDDYKDRDLTGKVAVFLVGDPPAPPDEPGLFDGRSMTYYGRWTYKFEEARRQGATGALIIHTDEAAGYGWDVVRTSWTGEQLMLPDQGDGAPLMVQGWMTRDLAHRVLAQAGIDLAELFVRAARRDFSPVATGVTVRARLNSRSRRVPARNVVGYLPGADATDEVVVFTAHYDHLGIGPAVDGDSIYNGAYDNASGVSLLLEVADAFSALEEAPRRGALFVATTAEEAGLLGSRYYVQNPLFPLESTVAAINVDGANLWGETDDVVALGAERSTLGDVLRPRAEEMGLRVRPDPEPEKGGSFRSDHFPFVLAGVPVLYIRHGLDFRDRPAGWGETLMERWAAENYHRPSDEYDPGFNLSGAVQQARLVFRTGLDLADSIGRPVER
ncbi:MAG: M28 family peptidase [Longimicrobiales bacterium]